LDEFCDSEYKANRFILIGNLLNREAARFEKIKQDPMTLPPVILNEPQFCLKFRSVLVEYLKLNRENDKSELTLDITLTILDDYLNKKLTMSGDDKIDMKEFYKRFGNIRFDSNQIESSKKLFQAIGFEFDANANKVSLPNVTPIEAYNQKLKLIYKVLIILKSK
jgi:hypothetical protein